MFSQTLGTALGDWTADSAGLGYLGSAVLFGALLGLVVLAYLLTRVSRTILFRSGLDSYLIRGAMVFTFFAFSIQKWSQYTIEMLKPIPIILKHSLHA